MTNISQWVLAFRPKTLTAAVVPILVGTAIAEQPQVWIAGLALLASLFIQIATNLVNDAKDFLKGADTEERVGPKRVTQAGVFSSRQVMLGAYFFFALAVLAGLPLVLHGGLPILVIGLFSLAAGYAYTGGPFPLAYRGLGDLFVFIFFGLIAVMGMHFLFDQKWSVNAAVAGAQIGLLCTVLIAINNLRDAPTDWKVGKRTLAVRFGKTFARGEIAFALLLPFVLQLHWWNQGFGLAAILPLLTFPLAVVIIAKVWRTEPGPVFNKFLGLSALQHILFGLLLTIGLLCRSL